jgi:hypothetical protein
MINAAMPDSRTGGGTRTTCRVSPMKEFCDLAYFLQLSTFAKEHLKRQYANVSRRFFPVLHKR